ncbi:MAG: tetratricopeptide repeat protein [Nitrospirae bacterium]|nr:tetratricopeptide repeat protein [Nitrospirota bacterium]
MKYYIILILLVIIAFANSLQNSFVWDDHNLILNNPKINIPVKEMPLLFKTTLWELSKGVRDVYYRPLVSLLFVLNYKIWGPTPMGFHLINILFHFINAILVYRVGLLLLDSDNKKLISLMAASIFAVHPVHNESVGRPAAGEPLFGLFIILFLYLFLRDRRYLSWIAFFLALLSKEAAVMLPFALVILTIYKKGIKRGVAEIIPYISLVGIYLIIRAMVVDFVWGSKIDQPVSAWIFTMAAATLDYTRLLIIPYPLSPYYPARWYMSVFETKVIFALLTLTTVSFIGFKIRKDKVMLFLLVFVFIMVVPVIFKVNTFRVGYELIAIFMVITISSNMVWKNDGTLFRKIVKEFPDASFAYNNLGVYFKEKGEFDKVIEYFEISLKTGHGSNALSYFNLGDVQYGLKNYEKALDYFKKALNFKSDEQLHLAALNKLGRTYSAMGQTENAIETFKKAIILFPLDTVPYNNLGVQYIKASRPDFAAEILEKGLKIGESPALRSNLSLAYAEQIKRDANSGLIKRANRPSKMIHL